MTIIPYTNQEQWHDLRLNHIGASEVAGLFNVEGAFNTRFELWLIKSGKIKKDIEDNQRMFWGRELEGAIGNGILKQKGWAGVQERNYYSSDKVEGMGCTPDFKVKNPSREGFGVLEVKNVDYASFAKWDGGEPPLFYILQLQQQLACTGFAWGAIGVLVNGNDLKVYEYDRHEPTIRKIEDEVAKFWQEVRSGIEPKAVAEDYEIIREYYAMKEGETIDLSGDNYIAELCRISLDAAERRKDAEKEEKAAKAEIIQKMAGAGFARCNGFTISRKEIIKNMAAKEAHIQRSEKLTIKELINE